MVLVIGFVFMLAFPVIFLLVRFNSSLTVDDIVKLITTISAAMSGLVGAVVGYYFGRLDRNDSGS
jgi:glycopeptide antibiotics resistance protein